MASQQQLPQQRVANQQQWQLPQQGPGPVVNAQGQPNVHTGSVISIPPPPMNNNVIATNNINMSMPGPGPGGVKPFNNHQRKGSRGNNNNRKQQSGDPRLSMNQNPMHASQDPRLQKMGASQNNQNRRGNNRHNNNYYRQNNHRNNNNNNNNNRNHRQNHNGSKWNNNNNRRIPPPPPPHLRHNNHRNGPNFNQQNNSQFMNAPGPMHGPGMIPPPPPHRQGPGQNNVALVGGLNNMGNIPPPPPMMQQQHQQQHVSAMGGIPPPPPPRTQHNVIGNNIPGMTQQGIIPPPPPPRQIPQQQQQQQGMVPGVGMPGANTNMGQQQQQLPLQNNVNLIGTLAQQQMNQNNPAGGNFMHAQQIQRQQQLQQTGYNLVNNAPAQINPQQAMVLRQQQNSMIQQPQQFQQVQQQQQQLPPSGAGPIGNIHHQGQVGATANIVHATAVNQFNPLNAQQQQFQQVQQQQQQAQTRQQQLQGTSSTQNTTNNNVTDSASPWTEHTAPSGIKYYYNSVTKESTYTKPADFLTTKIPTATSVDATNTSNTNTLTTKATNVMASPSQTHPTGANTKDTNNKSVSKWKEYTDASTGKKYYSDGKTTTWKRPVDFTDKTTNASSSHPNKKQRTGEVQNQSTLSVALMKEVSYASKEEATAAFKGLLLDKDITPIMKWADVIKICSSDHRWMACKTVGERKQALAEYQTKRANEQKELKRQEIKKAKDSFHKLMTDMLPALLKSHPNLISSSSSLNNNSNNMVMGGDNHTKRLFHECRDKIAKDDRFFAVENEETREELFFDFIMEIRKREERIIRAKKKTARDAFWGFLKERGDSITFLSTWAQFKSSLDEDSLKDPRYVTTAIFTDADRQVMFADYVIDLQTLEDEKRRRSREARLRVEKAQRDSYREFLRALAKLGKITIVSRWRNLEDTLEKDPTYLPVKTQDVDAPRMIFEDFVDDLKTGYRMDKTFLSRLISPSDTFPHGIIVNKDSEYDDFCDNLLKAAAAKNKDHEKECHKVIDREPVSSVKWFFNELVLRAKNTAATGLMNVSTSSGRVAGQNQSAAAAAAARSSLTVRAGSQSILDDESEDEGEIKEDGEIADANNEDAV